ncbi:signal peptide peptidase SppA, partial [Natronoarchaeum mannanilyticum]
MGDRLRGLATLAPVLAGAAIAAAIGYVLFVELPVGLAELLGIVLTLALALLGAKLAGNAVRSMAAGYDVAEVAG